MNNIIFKFVVYHISSLLLFVLHLLIILFIVSASTQIKIMNYVIKDVILTLLSFKYNNDKIRIIKKLIELSFV